MIEKTKNDESFPGILMGFVSLSVAIFCYRIIMLFSITPEETIYPSDCAFLLRCSLANFKAA